jgi:hypothetical protein
LSRMIWKLSCTVLNGESGETGLRVSRPALTQQVLPAPAHRRRHLPDGLWDAGAGSAGAFSVRPQDQYRICGETKPGHPPARGRGGPSGHHPVSGRGRHPPAADRGPRILPFLVAPLQCASAVAGARTDPWSGCRSVVAAGHPGAGGGLDGARVVAARGSPLARPTVAAASGKVTGWRSLGSCNEAGQVRLSRARRVS